MLTVRVPAAYLLGVLIFNFFSGPQALRAAESAQSGIAGRRENVPTQGAGGVWLTHGEDLSRPRHPWIFRGRIEGRAVTLLALHREMTVVFDEVGCAVFLVWKGDAVPKAAGNVRKAPEGSENSLPEYLPNGPIYYRRISDSPWSLRGPQGNIPVTVHFQFVRQTEAHAEFEYGIEVKGGAMILVRELPEFDDHYGQNGLFRNFTVTGIPTGDTLRLDMDGQGMPDTWGGGATGRVVVDGPHRFWEQETDGSTPIKVTWTQPGQ